MKRILALVLLTACSGSQRVDLTAEAVKLHCQVEVIQPLTVHPENVTAAQLLDALDNLKRCAAVVDAGPAL